MNGKIYYLAGLIDGEGTIGLPKSGKFRRPEISITSTTYEMMEFLYSNFGGCIVTQKTYKEHHKQAWIWKLTNDKAISIMEQVVDILLEPKKKARINLILNSYKKVTPRNGQYSEEDVKLKLAFEEEFFQV